MTPLEAALKLAAERCAGIIPHKIVGDATPEDFEALVKDLEVLCRRIVDPIIEAYGQYAALNARCTIDQSLFAGQLWSALEGNATYELETAAECTREAQEEYDADPVGWERAKLEGVD